MESNEAFGDVSGKRLEAGRVDLGKLCYEPLVLSFLSPPPAVMLEAVVHVNPRLAVYRDGQPYIVKYGQINAMSLNEFLKKHRQVEKLEVALRAVTARLPEQDAKI